jgi:hypothetical protein
MPKPNCIYQKLKAIADKEMEGRKQIDRNAFLSSVSSKFRLDKNDVRELLKEREIAVQLSKRKVRIL